MLTYMYINAQPRMSNLLKDKAHRGKVNEQPGINFNEQQLNLLIVKKVMCKKNINNQHEHVRK